MTLQKQQSESSLDQNGRLLSRQIIDAGKIFFDKNWVLGTSGNFSAVVSREPLRLLITASGKNKGELGSDDFVIVDEQGKPVDPSMAKPSAETMLHVVLAREAGAGSILHTHSVYSTILSKRFFGEDHLSISDLEMLKGLSGITTHDTRVKIKIFANTQDMNELADQLAKMIAHNDESVKHAFLICGHGLYTWGKDVAEARRHIEILEFLFEVIHKSDLYTSS